MPTLGDKVASWIVVSILVFAVVVLAGQCLRAVI